MTVLTGKCKEIVDAHVDYLASTDNDPIPALCIALAVSAKNTKHWQDAINLISDCRPELAIAIKKAHAGE